MGGHDDVLRHAVACGDVWIRVLARRGVYERCVRGLRKGLEFH